MMDIKRDYFIPVSLDRLGSDRCLRLAEDRDRFRALALVVDLNCGLRDKELRELRWQQIDLIDKKALTVGKSKTEAGTGRVVPLNETVLTALQAHAAWYIKRFGECKPEWYVFPAGKGQPNDPTRPVTTLRTAWTKVRDNAKVVGRWHDSCATKKTCTGGTGPYLSHPQKRAQTSRFSRTSSTSELEKDAPTGL